MKKLILYGLFIVTMIVTAVYSSSIINGNRVSDNEDVAYQNSYKHLQEITKEVHPSDSEEIIAVREYIESQLKDLGAAYQILEDGYPVSDWIELMVNQYEAKPKSGQSLDDTVAASYGFDTFRDYITDVARFMYGSPTADIPMKNILIKVDGTGEEGVMLVSHYDTSYDSYGAGDDGAAVAGMLEAIRTAVSQKNSNDLYFLFTDGEEKRLWGSHAFVQEHPEYKELIEAVFNIEGRGSDGTPILFETSANNSGLVKETSKALKYATGYSFIADIYQYMPNCSDLNEFMDAGYSGLNFAFSGIEENNHLPSDNLENLSENALFDTVMLQQDLVKYFAASDLSRLNSGNDAVFLPLIKGKLLVIPGSAIQVLVYIALAAVIALVFLYFLRRGINTKRILKSLLSLFLLLILVFAVIFVIGFPVSFIYMKLLNRTWGDHPDYAGFVYAGRLHYVFFWIQMTITGILTFFFIQYIKVRKAAEKELQVICLILEAAAMIGMMLVLNRIAYLIAVPALFTAVLQLVLWCSKEKGQKFLRIPAAFLNTVVTILILLPLVEAAYKGLRITYILWITPCLAVFIVIPLILSLLWLGQDMKKEPWPLTDSVK
jgi:hypothetical protein